MRNVWRAPFPDQFPLLYAMFKIYCNSYGPGHTHVLRTTLCVTFGARPRPLPAVPLERLFGQLGAKTAQGLRNGSARRPFGPPMSPTNVLRTLLRHARSYIRTFRWASSVVGSAMHMKWPDGIGREAGIGRTQNWKELTVFRACP